ncbi:MAG: hypothetical protein ABL963_13500 [Longimicrobiales bacterium]
MRFVLMLVAGLALTPQEPPPPFPRAGATKLLENDRVVVWDIAWLRQTYPLHRHPYDMTGVYYESGDRVIISPEGERRSTHTEAWNITFQRVGLTHSEEGSSDEPLRAVFVEMKQPSLGSLATGAVEAAFPAGGATQRLDNDRVTVWELDVSDSATSSSHRHTREMVLVSFDANNRPTARYVERGTVHDRDLPSGSARTFVFEID